MNEDVQITQLTSGQLTYLAGLEQGPFGDAPPPCLRNFWCGDLAQRWNLTGPVRKKDFDSMAVFKRPAAMLTQGAIEDLKRQLNPEDVSGAWSFELPELENYSKLAEGDPYLIDATEASIREMMTTLYEPRIHANLPGGKRKQTRLGAFCAFLYWDRALCFLFDVTLIEGAPTSYAIDGKLLSEPGHIGQSAAAR